jgi:hypothetical protein
MGTWLTSFVVGMMIRWRVRAKQVVVTRSTVELLIPGEKNREAVISLLHIIWAEVISSP